MKKFRNFHEAMQVNSGKATGDVPEQGRDAVGGVFTSAPPKKPYKSAPQVTSEDTKEPTGKLKDACWTGYTAVGMKMKNGRKVPNCVPIKEAPEAGDDPINQGTPEGLVRRGNKTVLKKFKELSMEGAVPSTEKVVTVRHKTSGKELRVAQHALASYKVGGYHPVSQVKEAKDEQEYGYEGDMALNQLATMIRCAEMIQDMLKPDTDMPEWVQSKITLATDYIQTAADYMYSEMKEETIQEGRPSQRHPLEGHEYHKKSDEALVHIAKDAHAAAEAMKGHNTDAENKYRDQANDSATVRHFRKTSGKPDWYKKKYGLKESFRPMDEPNYNNSIQARQKKADDANKPPFDGPYKKTPTVVTDKSGAKHGPMSRARDLARQAAKKQAGKMHEEKEKSRKAQIVKSASKSKDKFEKDPIITDTTVKTDNLQ
jgi:hypothetical protein